MKQVVDLGDQNENHILVVKGVGEGDVVLLTEPANAEDLDYTGMEIYEEIKLRKAKEAEEEKKAIEEEKQKEFKLQKKKGSGSPSVVIIG